MGSVAKWFREEHGTPRRRPWAVSTGTPRPSPRSSLRSAACCRLPYGLLGVTCAGACRSPSRSAACAMGVPIEITWEDDETASQPAAEGHR